jgi:uncharacterized membrane protein
MELEYIIKLIVPYVIHSLELIGIFIITVATLKCFYKYVKTIANPNKNTIKIDFAESVALALEFKLASEIIKTVIIKRMEDMYILGAVILLRVVLTFVIQWEIKVDSQKKQSTQKNNSTNANKAVK